MTSRLLVAFIFIGLSACASTVPASGTPTPSPTPAIPIARIAMAYGQDVQFAPFFVADQKGYFKQEGIQPIYGWGLEINGVRLLANNKIDFAILTGDQVIQARSQGLPLVYAANWYSAFPVEIISLKSKNILTPKDLIGKQVGLPGGASGPAYTAWRALLYSQKIDPTRITTQTIGLNGAPPIMQGKVDAAVAYAYFGPAELKLAGQEFNAMKVSDYAQLVGTGIATNETIIQQRPEYVKSFVRAFLKGVADATANPDEALRLSINDMPVVGGLNLDKSRAELDFLVPLWKKSPLGQSNLEDWQAMEQAMRQAGIIQKDLDVTKAFTNDFVQ